MAFVRHRLRRRAPAQWGRTLASKSMARNGPPRAEGSRPRSARASGLGQGASARAPIFRWAMDAERGAGASHACHPCLRTPASDALTRFLEPPSTRRLRRRLRTGGVGASESSQRRRAQHPHARRRGRSGDRGAARRRAVDVCFGRRAPNRIGLPGSRSRRSSRRNL